MSAAALPCEGLCGPGPLASGALAPPGSRLGARGGGSAQKRSLQLSRVGSPSSGAAWLVVTDPWGVGASGGAGGDSGSRSPPSGRLPSQRGQRYSRAPFVQETFCSKFIQQQLLEYFKLSTNVCSLWLCDGFSFFSAEGS